MSNFTDGLNSEQARAVTHADGPLLILAGAGSGKTKTLTHRIAYLIGELKIFPSRILAVTFTNKAAKEMRQRLAQILGEDSENRQFMRGWELFTVFACECCGWMVKILV